MLPSQIGAVIDALKVLSQGAVGSAVPVYDGLPTTNAIDVDLVIVGDQGDDLAEDASTFQQTWAGLGARAKDETGSVSCVVISSTGDSGEDVVKGRRDRALQLLALIETAHRGNVNLGGLVLFSAIEGGNYQPIQNGAGTAVRLGFTVTYKARI